MEDQETYCTCCHGRGLGINDRICEHCHGTGLEPVSTYDFQYNDRNAAGARTAGIRKCRGCQAGPRPAPVTNRRRDDAGL